MDRINRQDLVHLVVNALRFGAKADRREMEQHETVFAEDALTRVAARVCDQIDNDSRAVMQIAPIAGIPFDSIDKWEGR